MQGSEEKERRMFCRVIAVALLLSGRVISSVELCGCHNVKTHYLVCRLVLHTFFSAVLLFLYSLDVSLCFLPLCLAHM